MPEKYIDADRCEYMARCYVNGTTRDRDDKLIPHAAHWHERFHDHPWVRESEMEGWGRELRSVVITNLKRQILREQHRFRYPSIIDHLMPDAKWIANAKIFAAKVAAAEEWRKQQGDDWLKPRPISHTLKDVTRDAFRTMQRASPNRSLHVDHNAIAKRITGERD